ncbi:MAG: hypothetical protein MJ057_00870 [Sphaerochaetaceae bacterium]|nr:hypothetical protein [Sphaerochaetaceae bacterium]
MKKIIIALFAVLMVCAAVFADVPSVPVATYDNIDFSFAPTSARFNAMGQSGLADPSRIDSFFSNPAALGKGGFAISVPSFAFTVYNVQALISDEQAMAAVNEIASGDSDGSVDLALAILENLGTGHNMVMKMDAGFAVRLGIFGLGTNVQAKFHSLNEGSSLASLKLVTELNIAQTAALGLKVVNTDLLSVSAGVSAHAIFKAYNKAMGANDVLSIMQEDDAAEKILWEQPIMAGSAITFDAGATVGFLNDQISLSVTANNLNGVYKMQSFTSAGDLVNALSEGTMEAPEGHIVGAPVDFEVKTPWTLNFGFAFTPDMYVIHPTVTLDLIDMFGMIQNFSSETFRASDLLLHLNAGAEVDLFNVATIRAGVDRGYMSIGAGINLFVIGIDATYGWQEFGEELGDKPVDSFTIKFNIGYDK